MDNTQEQKQLSQSVFRFSLLASALQDFSSQLITHATKGTPLSDEALEVIQSKCVLNLKNNCSLEGLGIVRENAFLQQAVIDLRRAMERAIVIARGV